MPFQANIYTVIHQAEHKLNCTEFIQLFWMEGAGTWVSFNLAKLAHAFIRTQITPLVVIDGQKQGAATKSRLYQIQADYLFKIILN